MTMKMCSIDSLTGYEQYYGYSVNEAGEVFSSRQSSSGEYKQLKPGYKTKKSPYQFVRLCGKDGHQKQHYIHRLVATAFIPNEDRLATVNHINKDVKDNRVCNLEWLSWKDNCYSSEDQLLYKRYKQLVDDNGQLL